MSASMWIVLVVAVLAVLAVVAFLVMALPDVLRYRRIRRM